MLRCSETFLCLLLLWDDFSVMIWGGNGCMDGGRRGKEWNAFLAFTIGLIPWSDGAGRENTSL